MGFTRVQIMSDNIQQLQRDALIALGRVLHAADAKPADILRAAEILLKADAPQSAGRMSLAATDDELLGLDRGEGGRPPVMGPAGTSAAAVPSDARKVGRPKSHPNSPGAGPKSHPNANIPLRPEKAAPAPLPAARGPKEDPDNLGRTPGLFLRRGPKTDPRGVPPPGGPLPPAPQPAAEGTQNGPAPNSTPTPTQNGNPISGPIDPATPIRHAPGLEPWE